MPRSRDPGFPWIAHVVLAIALATEEMGRLGIFRYGIATGDGITTEYPWWRGDDVAWGGIAVLILVMPWAVMAEAWAVVKGAVWLARITVVGYTLPVAVINFVVTTSNTWADTGIPVFILGIPRVPVRGIVRSAHRIERWITTRQPSAL